MTYYRDENGEYIRTVTCSYCWTRGHNRSGCPDRAEKIEQQRAEDPDSYNVRNYDREKKNKKYYTHVQTQTTWKKKIRNHRNRY